MINPIELRTSPITASIVESCAPAARPELFYGTVHRLPSARCPIRRREKLPARDSHHKYSTLPRRTFLHLRD